VAKRVPPTFNQQPTAVQVATPNALSQKPVVQPAPAPLPQETEEDKINAVIAGAGSYATPAAATGTVRRSFPPIQQRVPPPGYVCYRCGQPGHFIQHCPTNGDPRYDVPKVKRALGIPRKFLQEIRGGKTEDIKDMKGVVRLADGTLAKVRPDEETFKKAVATVDNPHIREETPSELQCPICELLLDDAVLVPCCGNSFCSQCKFYSIPTITITATSTFFFFDTIRCFVFFPFVLLVVLSS